ncbi:hypothetical protein LUR56_40050 [Streptomyces sp. MT29]|nr:hypothetical protein [Streptomyces sp. MT29]
MTITKAQPRPEAGRSHLQESLFSWLTPDVLEPVRGEIIAPPVVPAAKKVAQDLSHSWVVAAEVPVTPKIAKIADHRGSFKTTQEHRIDALEVYCKGCRRPFDEVSGEDCSARIDNRHLIGGDQSTRAKRKIPTPPPTSRVVAGGRLQRRGIDAYVAGVSRPPR